LSEEGVITVVTEGEQAMSKPQGQGADGTHAAAFLEPTEEGSRNEEPKGPPVDDRDNALEELTYEPVPPRRSVSIQVTCHLQGRGRPLPFSEHYLVGQAMRLGPRWRLRSPFLEHFSQAFARFFMRVGLPSSIPEFK
jgi:hypothetical protein